MRSALFVACAAGIARSAALLLSSGSPLREEAQAEELFAEVWDIVGLPRPRLPDDSPSASLAAAAKRRAAASQEVRSFERRAGATSQELASRMSLKLGALRNNSTVPLRELSSGPTELRPTRAGLDRFRRSTSEALRGEASGAKKPSSATVLETLCGDPGHIHTKWCAPWARCIISCGADWSTSQSPNASVVEACWGPTDCSDFCGTGGWSAGGASLPSPRAPLPVLPRGGSRSTCLRSCGSFKKSLAECVAPALASWQTSSQEEPVWRTAAETCGDQLSAFWQATQLARADALGPEVRATLPRRGDCGVHDFDV